MAKARKSGSPTDAEYRAVMSSFTPEEREAVDLMRRQLTEAGVTKEPMRTRMACEFAGVLVASRKKGGGDGE